MPVWKKEHWPGGAEWVLDTPVTDVPVGVGPEGGAP